MAKKFVRGVTGIEDIESYDKTLTNVNDILSDGQDTYLHTIKGKTESYYKLTDSVKQVKSSDSTLTISKDDSGNVSISNNNLATKEELAAKENTLSVDYGISKTTSGNTTKLGVEYTKVNDGFDLNSLSKGFVRGKDLTNAPTGGWYFIDTFGEGSYIIQKATHLNSPNTQYIRLKWVNNWTDWREQVGDKSTIDSLLVHKQNSLTSNTSIAVLSNNQLQQLFSQKKTYTHANGLLKTHVINVAENTTVTTSIEELNFTVKINQNAENIVVTLNEHDTTAFNKIMTKYGSDNTVRISGCVFTLTGSSLTVSTTNNTAQNYVMSFSDILD